MMRTHFAGVDILSLRGITNGDKVCALHLLHLADLEGVVFEIPLREIAAAIGKGIKTTRRHTHALKAAGLIRIEPGQPGGANTYRFIRPGASHDGPGT
jgi:DNA-binding IscR family transcriptional regulator